MDPEDLLTPKVIIPVVAVLVVLLGVAIAGVRALMGRGRAAAVQRWCRGAYGLWTGGEDCGAWPAARAQSALESWYGAGSSAKLWQVIRELRAGQTGNPAWDRVRALDLLRIATAATFIDAEQCWKESCAIGVELQARFRSWEDLAQAFEAGMHAWQRARQITDPQQLGRVQRNLPALRRQIWPAAPFHTKLVVED